MASKPPPKPKPPSNIEDKNARSQYEKDLTAYYEKQGVKKANDQADRDIEALRNAARDKEAAAKLTPEERKRIDDQHRRTLGRAANDFELSFFNKKTDEEMNEYLVNSIEYQQKKGNLKVLSNRGDGGGGQTIVVYDTEGGRALMENEAFLRHNFKDKDTIITPKSVSDLRSSGDFDVWKERKEGKTKVTSEMLQANPWLKSAGYGVGDFLTESTRVVKPKSGVFNWVDDALGTNTARFFDKYVPNELKFALDPLGAGTTSFLTRNARQDALAGGADIFNTSEANVARGQAYVNAAIDIGLTLAGFGAAVAVKRGVQGLSDYQQGKVSGEKLLVNIGKDAALAYVGASSAQSASAAAQTTQTAATVGQTAAATGQTIATGSRIANAARTVGSAVQTGVRAVTATTGGTLAARAAVEYGFNRATGLSESAASREALWSAAGAGTKGAATLVRFATSETALNSLRDPVTGKIDPIRATQAAVSIGGSLYEAATSKEGFIASVTAGLRPSAWSPVAGAARLAEGATTFYKELAGTTTTVGTPAAVGEEPYSADVSASTYYQPTFEGSRNVGLGESLTAIQPAAEIGGTAPSDMTRVSTITQNRLPSLQGLYNVGASFYNVALFGQRRPSEQPTLPSSVRWAVPSNYIRPMRPITPSSSLGGTAPTTRL